MAPSTDPHASAPPSHGWRSHVTLLILMFTYAMSLIDRQIMGVLIEPVKKEFGATDTEMGLLTGLTFALFFSVVAVPLARWSDRSNRRNFVAWACAAWSAMTAACGMATSFMGLAAARVGVAVGEAGGTPPSLSMIADHYPPRMRARAMSVFMLGPHLGTLFGLGLGAWIAHQYGWRAAFLWMAVPGVVAALMLRYLGTEPLRGRFDLKREEGAADRDSVGTVARDMLRSPVFVWVTVAGLLMGFAGYGFGIWNTAFLVRSHGLSLKDAGMLVGGVSGLSAIIGALASGWLCDKLAARDARWHLGVPILGTVLCLPFGFAYLLWPAAAPWHLGPVVVPQAMAFALMFSVFAVWWPAPAYTVLSAIVPSARRATVIALYNLGLSMVGAGLGPLAVGLLSDGLSASAGPDALRWAMAIVLCAFGFAVFAYGMALRPYAAFLKAAKPM